MTALTHEQVQKILRAGTQPEGIEKVGFIEHLAHCRQCQSYQRLVRELSTDLPALYPVAHFTERQIRQKAAASKSVLEPRFTVARAWHSLRSAALVAIPLLMIIALGVLAWKLIPVRPAAPVPVTQTPTQLISSTPAPTEVTGTQRSVSPDGQFIAVFYPDNPRVEIIDATGTVVVQYPAPSEWIMLGTWSPDSRHFTFWVGGKSGSLQADGLPFYGMDIPSGQTHQLSPATIVNLTWQSWSPDGKSLVFTDGNYRSAQFNKWLSLYNTNTGQTVVLVPMETLVTGAVSWSPTGSEIAVAAVEAAKTGADFADYAGWDNPAIAARRIYLVNPQSGESVPLVPSADTYQDAPRFSQDGKKLYFVQRDGGSARIMEFDRASSAASAVSGCDIAMPYSAQYYGQVDWSAAYTACAQLVELNLSGHVSSTDTSLMGTEFPAPESRPASSFQPPAAEEMVVVQPDTGNLTTYIPKEWQANLQQKKETPMISAILAAPDESTWFASMGGVSVIGTGVYRYDGRKWTRYTTQTGLPSDEITAMVAARDRAIWFSTLCCGVVRYDGSSWATYTVKNGLASNDVPSMAVAGDGAIWFGTGNQGVTRFDGTRWKTFTTADGLHGNYVGNIYALPDGSVLLSTSDGSTAAMDRFDGQTWSAYPTDWTDQGKYTRKIAQTPRGELWYATEFDGIYTRPGGAAWSHFTVENGLLSNTITGLAVDPRGNIWVGTDLGLSVMKGSTWQSYTAADGLAANAVTDVAAGLDGSVWVGTAGGISRFPPPTMEEILSTYVTSNSFGVGFGFDKASSSPLLALNSSVKGLVPYDQTGIEYPYIYNLDTGIVFPIYPTIGGNNTLAPPAQARSLSADGRFLLYGLSSNSPEPAAEHYNFIYLRDLTSGRDTKIDFLPLEKELGTGIYPTLSPDGRYFALNAGENGWQLYLYERSTGIVTPVAVDLGSRFISGATSTEPVFSADGRYLAFVSDSSKLVEGDTACSDANPACGDVFLYEIATGKLERIPASIQFTMGNPYPYLTVSADARYLAWTELLANSPVNQPVIRLHDRVTGKTRQIWAEWVVGASGPPYYTGHSPAISADGRWLAFGALAHTNQDGSADPQAYAQVYLMDLQAANPDDATILVSADPNGNPGNGPSGVVALQQEGWSSDVHISADGRYVAFSSQAASLLPAGGQPRQCNDPIVVGAYACYDLYVYDHQTGKLTWLGPQGELKKPVP